MSELRAPKWKVLSRLTPYLREHSRRIGLGFICVLLTNVLLVANPWVIRYAFNSFNQSVTKEKLAYYASILIALTLAQGVFRFWTRWILIEIGRAHV